MRALAIGEQQLGPEHPDTASSLINLAAIYGRRPSMRRWKPLLVRALVIYEQKLGAMHPETGRNLDFLAELYHEQGKYQQAEPLFVLRWSPTVNDWSSNGSSA